MLDFKEGMCVCRNNQNHLWHLNPIHTILIVYFYLLTKLCGISQLRVCTRKKKGHTECWGNTNFLKKKKDKSQGLCNSDSLWFQEIDCFCSNNPDVTNVSVKKILFYPDGWIDGSSMQFCFFLKKCGGGFYILCYSEQKEVVLIGYKYTEDKAPRIQLLKKVNFTFNLEITNFTWFELKKTIRFNMNYIVKFLTIPHHYINELQKWPLKV